MEDSSSSRRSFVSWLALLLTVVLLALHWLHPAADSATKLGWFGPQDWSSDLYTDEGWAAGGALHAALRGTWYLPGDFNLAVDAPGWSLLLLLPFKVFGVSIVVARALSTGLYAASVFLAYRFVMKSDGRLTAGCTAALLAANFFAFSFSRLAITESAWIFFLLGALVVAQSASTTAGARALWLCLLAGMILGLAVLTKLTAIFGAAPLLTVLFLARRSGREFLKLAGASCAGMLLLAVPYRSIVLPRFPLDHQFYTRINVSDRAITNVSTAFHHLKAMLLGARFLDLALYACFWIGLGAALLAWRRMRPYTLTIVGLVWFAANLGVYGTVDYFPPRYCLSLLLPITLLAVSTTREAYERSRPLGVFLMGLLAVSFLLNAVESIAFVLQPAYSYRNLARMIPHTQGGVMGDFADTVSLFTAVPSLNDKLGTGSRLERIERYHPATYLSIGPAEAGAAQDFKEAGGALQFEQTLNLLKNYGGRQPVYLYAVRWPKP